MKKLSKLTFAFALLMFMAILTGCSTNYEKTYSLDKEVKGTELTQEEYIEEKKEEDKKAADDSLYKKITIETTIKDGNNVTKNVVIYDLENKEYSYTTTKNDELVLGTWVTENKNYTYSKDADGNETKVYTELSENEINATIDIDSVKEVIDIYTSIVSSITIQVSTEGIEVVKDSKGNVVITVNKDYPIIGNINFRMVFEDYMLVFFTYKKGNQETSMTTRFGEAKISFPSFKDYKVEE